MQEPKNWPIARKYTILSTAVITTLLTAVNCASVTILSPFGQEYFGVSREVFLLSLTVMMICVASTPLVLAPLSEVVSCEHEYF